MITTSAARECNRGEVSNIFDDTRLWDAYFPNECPRLFSRCKQVGIDPNIYICRSILLFSAAQRWERCQRSLAEFSSALTTAEILCVRALFQLDLPQIPAASESFLPPPPSYGLLPPHCPDDWHSYFLYTYLCQAITYQPNITKSNVIEQNWHIIKPNVTKNNVIKPNVMKLNQTKLYPTQSIPNQPNLT